MTSTSAIFKRKELDEKLRVKGAVLGDIYIRPYGECHPDFISTPINHPAGARICVRKAVVENQHPPVRFKSSSETVVLKNKKNLYSSTLPDDFSKDRTRGINIDYHTMPHQESLLKGDYLKWERVQKGVCQTLNGLGIPNEIKRY